MKPRNGWVRHRVTLVRVAPGETERRLCVVETGRFRAARLLELQGFFERLYGRAARVIVLKNETERVA